VLDDDDVRAGFIEDLHQLKHDQVADRQDVF
jgi:hypothetical protein